MTATIIEFPINRCRQVLTVDQIIEASLLACRQIFDQAASDFSECRGDGLAITAMMRLSCEGSCTEVSAAARDWLSWECGVLVA